MTKGVLLFAHNNPDVDYGLMAIIAGGLAKKNLGVPASLVTDKWTLKWLEESNRRELAEDIFEHIIVVEKPVTQNTRKLHDGFHHKQIAFENSNRYSAYELSPYDQTLLIDTDYLVMSSALNEYWDVDSSVMIGHSMNDIIGDRIGILDKRVSETGVHMFWATNVMFRKDQESKFFFKLVDFVRENYRYYADLFRFDPRQYRNDISFSVAYHIMNGFETNTTYSLPPIRTVSDKDILIEVENDKLTFLLDQPMDCGSFWAATSSGLDIHIMNKQSIIRNADKLLELI